MRRIAPLLVLAGLIILTGLLTGCGSGETVSPTAETVIGTLPTTTQATTAKGDANAGKALFASKGCSGCHTFAPAGSHSSTGPDLDKLADYAKSANRGSLQDFTAESIRDPGAFVQSGYSNIMPDFGLSDTQIADLTAYLTQG
jgi:mono/diheme cytochrome c family protein